MIFIKKKLLGKIEDPAVRKEMRNLFNNGFDLNEDHLRDFCSEDLHSNLLQILPTVNESKILENIGFNVSVARNIFMIVKANEGLYWKAAELVKFISEKSDAEIVWNFHPTDEMEQVMRIVTISY